MDNITCKEIQEKLKTLQGYIVQFYDDKITYHEKERLKYEANNLVDYIESLFPIDYAQFREIRDIIHPNIVEDVALTQDGKTIFSATRDGIVYAWDKLGGKRKQFKASEPEICSIVASKDGKYIITAGFDGKVHVFDVRQMSRSFSLIGHKDLIHKVILSPDEKYIISCSEDKTVRVWDIQKQTLKKVISGHEGIVRHIAIHPSGSKIASSDFKVNLILFSDVNTGKEISFRGPGPNEERLGPMVWGTHQFIASEGNEMRTYLVTNDEDMISFQGHEKPVTCLHLSSDGQFLVSGSSDQTIRVWNTKTGECIKILKGHTGEVTSVHFTDNGRYIISSGSDASVKIWGM